MACEFLVHVNLKCRFKALSQMLVIEWKRWSACTKKHSQTRTHTLTYLANGFDCISMGFRRLLFYFGNFRFRLIFSHFNCILFMCVEPTLCAINHRHGKKAIAHAHTHTHSQKSQKHIKTVMDTQTQKTRIYTLIGMLEMLRCWVLPVYYTFCSHWNDFFPLFCEKWIDPNQKLDTVLWVCV